MHYLKRMCGGCGRVYYFPSNEPGYRFICPECNPTNYNGLARPELGAELMEDDKDG